MAAGQSAALSRDTDAVAAARSLWPPPADGRHVVDVLLEERAPRLMRSPFWPLLNAPLFAMLDYARARESADALRDMDGRAALEYVSTLLRLDVRARRLDRIPREGRCVIVANHPTGIADGVALYDALAPLRPDLCFFANADALRVCPGFTDTLIPVEWNKELRSVQKTKLTLRLARRAIAENRALAIFPAGAPARRFGVVIKEPPWERSALALARKHGTPLVPVNVSGPPSYLYHVFGLFSRELRNVTLFREFLNKVGRRYNVRVGPVIDASKLEGDTETLTRRLRAYVVRTLAHSPDCAFT